MVPLFLRSLEYSLCLLSLIWDNLYSLPFDDGFFTLCPSPKLLWLSWTSLFCLSRSSSCWCIPPGRFDIHLCVSSRRSLILPYAFQLMLDMDDLYQPYRQLFQPCISPGTVASLAKTSFWLDLQASPVYLYFTLCNCPEGQSIFNYSYWSEFITIPNCYNTMKEF